MHAIIVDYGFPGVGYVEGRELRRRASLLAPQTPEAAFLYHHQPDARVDQGTPRVLWSGGWGRARLTLLSPLPAHGDAFLQTVTRLYRALQSRKSAPVTMHIARCNFGAEWKEVPVRYEIRRFVFGRDAKAHRVYDLPVLEREARVRGKIIGSLNRSLQFFYSGHPPVTVTEDMLRITLREDDCRTTKIHFSKTGGEGRALYFRSIGMTAHLDLNGPWAIGSLTHFGYGAIISSRAAEIRRAKHALDEGFRHVA